MAECRPERRTLRPRVSTELAARHPHHQAFGAQRLAPSHCLPAGPTTSPRRSTANKRQRARNNHNHNYNENEPRAAPPSSGRRWQGARSAGARPIGKPIVADAKLRCCGRLARAGRPPACSCAVRERLLLQRSSQCNTALLRAHKLHYIQSALHTVCSTAHSAPSDG